MTPDDATQQAGSDPIADATILVVDDDADLRAIVRILLESRFAKVLEAGSSEFALDLARRVHPDLLIVDWMMPRISGLEVAVELRKDPGCRRTAVMMLTARNESADIDRGLEAGVDSFLVKPFRPTELLTTVEASLLRYAGTPAAEGVRISNVG